MASDETPVPPSREAYVPPAVDRIRIVQNEMAVASCKGTTHGVTVARSCRTSVCKTPGR
jgi:hypothetical protein